MFDTLAYIPTVLAYVFISLLVSILCFIIVYVSHKVYISISDRLNVALTDDDEDIFHKVPPALTITISYGRCYLATQIIEPKGMYGPRIPKFSRNFSALVLAN